MGLLHVVFANTKAVSLTLAFLITYRHLSHGTAETFFQCNSGLNRMRNITGPKLGSSQQNQERNEKDSVYNGCFIYTKRVVLHNLTLTKIRHGVTPDWSQQACEAPRASKARRGSQAPQIKQVRKERSGRKASKGTSTHKRPGKALRYIICHHKLPTYPFISQFM